MVLSGFFAFLAALWCIIASFIPFLPNIVLFPIPSLCQEPQRTTLPLLDIQLSESDFQDIRNNRGNRVGRVVYDGRVWDNVEMRKSGRTSINTAKGSFRLDFPRGDPFVAPFLDAAGADELTIDQGFPNFDNLREKLAWEMVADAGMESILSTNVRVTTNGRFYGLYLLREEQDGDWRNRHGLDNGPVYKFEDSNGGEFGFAGVIDKKEFEDEPDTDLIEFRVCLDETGDALRSCMLDQADIPQLANEFAAVALVQQTDQQSFNFFLYQDFSQNGLWRMQPDDLDRVLGLIGGDFELVVADGTPTFRRCMQNEICRAFMRLPEFQTMYNRRLRTLADEVLADPKWRTDLATLATQIEDDWGYDEALWRRTSFSFDQAIDALDGWFVDYLAHLRSGGHDGLVPSAQSATPLVEVTEYRPDSGDGLSYVMIRNPSDDESVDISNWPLGPVEVPAGLVVLPGATVAITNNDAAFRVEQPSFDGIRGYIGSALTGDLTLQRRDGSTAATLIVV